MAAAPASLTIVDAATGQAVPCRIHFKNSAGNAVHAPGLPFWRDHFVCPGHVRLDLEPGRYTYEVERGPEYVPARGEWEIKRVSEGPNDFTLNLHRLVDMKQEGWWSGETHVHRKVSDVTLLMQAEDLHVAQAITWWNDSNLWTSQALPEDPLLTFDQNRFCHVMAGEDERGGGALLYFNLRAPLQIAGAEREFPAAVSFLNLARLNHGRDLWVDIEKPFWWDTPIWLASGQVDSVGLAHNHMQRGGVLENEAWGRARDRAQYPTPQGNGFWTQDIYYHVLNCGLRIPPTAGSASGVLPNPVGYNRVYVQTGPTLTYSNWWEGLRAGRVFVSNGPLLRVRANDQWPGHVFSAPANEPLVVRLEGQLDAVDKLARVEIIQDGVITQLVDPELVRSGHPFATLTVQRSGWFLVRVLADIPGTFRFASTGPFYIETPGRPRRIQRESALFFLDWVRRRRERVVLEDETQRESVLATLEKAEQFWAQKVEQAEPSMAEPLPK